MLTIIPIAISTLLVTSEPILPPPNTTDAAHASTDLAPIDLQAVSIINPTTGVALPGATRPAQQVTLSTQFDTMLRELLVEEGQTVRAGDPIAILDDRVARSSLHLAEQTASNTASIERAQAALDRAKTVLARTQSAVESGAANSDELDAAQSQASIAQAELRSAIESHDRAQLELELARARVEQHIVRAPFDATVLRTHTEPGAVISTKDPIADLATLDLVRVDLYLPAETARPLVPGQLCALDLQDPLHAVLPAAVRYVEQRIDPTSRTQRVVFEFNIPGATPPIGMLVHPAKRAPTQADIARARAEPQRFADALPDQAGE